MLAQTPPPPQAPPCQLPLRHLVVLVLVLVLVLVPTPRFWALLLVCLPVAHWAATWTMFASLPLRPPFLCRPWMAVVAVLLVVVQQQQQLLQL